MKTAGLLATRRSLVERLADWGDQLRWQEFFDTYWKLICSAARQSGLTDAEAQEVVQVTVITVAKNIDNSNMIRQLARLKAGCCRSRAGESPINFENVNRGNAKRPRSADDRLTATIERVPDSRFVDLDEVWDAEWKENLFEAAIARVKKKIEPTRAGCDLRIPLRSCFGSR